MTGNPTQAIVDMPDDLPFTPTSAEPKLVQHPVHDDGEEHASMSGPLRTVEAIRRYIEGGNGVLTVRSRKSGTRFTFRTKRPKLEEVAEGRGRPIWVSLLSGPSNVDDYAFLGTLWPSANGFTYRHSPKSRTSESAPSVRALKWIAHGLNVEPDAFLQQAEFWHEGRCGRCGRRLTVPESIELGFGPECAGRA